MVRGRAREPERARPAPGMPTPTKEDEYTHYQLITVTLCRAPRTAHRAPCTVHRAPCTVHRAPCRSRSVRSSCVSALNSRIRGSPACSTWQETRQRSRQPVRHLGPEDRLQARKSSPRQALQSVRARAVWATCPVRVPQRTAQGALLCFLRANLHELAKPKGSPEATKV